MSEVDPSILERLRNGDRDALGQFIVARRDPLLRYIERSLGYALRAKLEPEDILQEVSGEAVRSLDKVTLGERDPFGWLCQIAERKIIDAHRHFVGAQKRSAAKEVALAGNPDSSRAALLDYLVASMTTASQAFSRDQRRIKLETAMAELGAEQQEALRLRYGLGLPSKEIAERLGKSDGAVRVMLTRSLAQIQKILGQDGEGK